MAVLLVAMSIMAVMMTVAMPVWKQLSQREKEEELVFRGRQYARAVGLYGRKFANATPPSLDVLLQQRFLRRKYKDPITNDDFQLLLAGQVGNGAATPGGSSQPANQQGGQGGQQPGQPSSSSTGNAGATGGIVGVTSKSKAASIRVYNGRTHYNEWVFTYTSTTQGIGGGGGAQTPGQGQGQGSSGGAGQPGGRGGTGNPNNPNGRGFGRGNDGGGPGGFQGGFPGGVPGGNPSAPVQPFIPNQGRGR